MFAAIAIEIKLAQQAINKSIAFLGKVSSNSALTGDFLY
jgi:hypothetical protein